MRTWACSFVITACVFAQNPDAGSGLFHQAVQAQQDGKYELAIGDYRKFLGTHPNSPDAWANLGAALVHTGKWEAAVEAYRSALKLDGGNEAIRTNLGLAFYKQGSFADAAAEFRAVHQKQAANLRATVLLADCEARLGQDTQAIALLEPLEAGQPGNPDVEYILGSALIRQHRRQDGAAMLERVALATANAAAYLLAGSTFLQLNDYERAKSDLQAARELDGKLPDLHTLYGIVLDDLGDADGAVRELRAALRSRADDIQANLLLGAILVKKRELAAAKPLLVRAVELDPEAAMGHYELALLHSAQGDNADALNELEKAAARQPEWLQPHVQLAALYYRMHREADGARERQIVDRLTEREREVEGKP